ncbi:MAG: hypothetical protein E7287_07090 [Lachnospiraceae bacterium]|nr:hypothetical protein [Lachnospiraceae bacterium]
MKKVNSKQVFSYVALVGILAVALFYVMFYMKYEEKTTALIQENGLLKSRVATLKAYHKKADEYRSKVDAMQEGIGQLLEEYPANALEEDALMLAVDMEKHGNIKYSVINIGEDEQIYSIPESTVKAAGYNDLQNSLVFVEKRVTYGNDISYGSLKSCIEEIYKNKNKIAVSNIVYLRDEEGKLTGNIDVSFYSVRGTGKEYVKPDIDKYMAGKADLFK